MQGATENTLGIEAGVDYERLIAADRVHGSLYTDPRVFADEMARVFLGGWVFVGHDSEIPKIGVGLAINDRLKKASHK